MKKIISLLLIILLSFGLVSCYGGFCNPNNSDDADRVGANNSENPLARYSVSILLDSYDELLLAGKIYENNGGKRSKYYTFDGEIEDYKPYYYFTSPNAWITPTDDIEEFFSANHKHLSLGSYLFDTTGEKCSCERHKEQILEDVENSPYIEIRSLLSSNEIIEIEDASLLVMTSCYSYEGINEGFEYNFSYNGENVFRICSCRELSQEALAELLTHIVIW